MKFFEKSINILYQALTPPIRLYPPNAGPILPGMLGAAALGAQANVAAVAAGASAAAIQAAYDSSSNSVMYIYFCQLILFILFIVIPASAMIPQVPLSELASVSVSKGIYIFINMIVSHCHLNYILLF